MFKIGELLVYGPAGIMKLVDIKKEDITGEIRDYYVLEDVGSKSSSKTFVPCENEYLVSMMRPVISKERALEVIKMAKNVEPCAWERDNRIRAKKFREIIDSSNHEKIISVIKAIYENAKEREAIGKKGFLLDETLMEKAQRLLHSELSWALGVPLQEIPALFEENSK